MTHFVVLIIIPHHIFIQGVDAILSYIEEIMSPYSEELRVIPYISITKENVELEYQKFKQSPNYSEQYDTISKYQTDYCGYNLIDSDGNILSTYNRNCFWDYYEIGGRWHGILTNNEQEVDQIKGNSIKVKDFLSLYEHDPESNIYMSVLDKNGAYQSQRKYGWFGSYDEKIADDEWKVEFETILHNSIDDYIVGLDCHI